MFFFLSFFDLTLTLQIIIGRRFVLETICINQNSEWIWKKSTFDWNVTWECIFQSFFVRYVDTEWYQHPFVQWKCFELLDFLQSHFDIKNDVRFSAMCKTICLAPHNIHLNTKRHEWNKWANFQFSLMSLTLSSRYVGSVIPPNNDSLQFRREPKSIRMFFFHQG